MSGRKYIGHGAGYLLNDNRAAGEGKQETDVILCPHCQTVISIQKWKAADGSNGWCSRCAAPCCGSGPCAAEFQSKGCLPFIKKIESIAQRAYSRAQFRKVAGLEPEQPTLLYRGPPTS